MDWGYWLPYWFDKTVDVVGTIIAGVILARVFKIGNPPKVPTKVKITMLEVMHNLGRMI